MFTSIESRVPGGFCSEVLESPTPKSKSKAKQSGGLTAVDFEVLAKELAARPAEAFPRDARAHCIVHDQHCFGSASAGGRSTLSFGRDSTGASDQDGQESVVMSAAGLPCVAWSRVGLRQAGGHISERAFQVWLAERRQWALDGCEDMFLFENVVGVSSPREDPRCTAGHSTMSSFCEWTHRTDPLLVQVAADMGCHL